MLTNASIRKITAGFLLAILAFTVTPKIMLHQVISNHKEALNKRGDATTCQVNTFGFNCKYDNLVVDAPFVDNIIFITFLLQSSFHEKPSLLDQQVYSTDHFISLLRGPPMFS